MHIVLIYHFFAHYRGPIIRRLKKEVGWSIDCVASGSSNKIDRTILPISSHDLPDLIETPLWAYRDWVWQRGLLSFLLRSDAKVFIFLASPYFLSTWIGALILRIRGKRILFWGHLRLPINDRRLKRVFKYIFYRLAHGWLPYGHRAKTELIASGLNSDKIHVIYNSLDYARHLELRSREMGVSPADALFKAETLKFPLLICVSRLVTKRRLDILLNAMFNLKLKGKYCRLLLIGDGPQRLELEKMATALELPVVFYGPCYDDLTLRSLYQGAAATVAPGEVGLTAIQSLSFGVPVITHSDLGSQMPEAESILDGLTGWLFAKGNQSSLEDALEQAMMADHKKMRVKCYEMIDCFFNPERQVTVIRNACLGLKPDEDDWWRLMEGNANEIRN